jgi:hypothetical protein
MIKIFNKLSFFYFIIAFSVGLFVCYIMAPTPEVVIKFPSPYNAGRVLYKDKSDTCYRFRADRVACPINTSLIKPQPIMEDFRHRQK